jgi:hypothetical protein
LSINGRVAGRRGAAHKVSKFAFADCGFMLHLSNRFSDNFEYLGEKNTNKSWN